MLNAVSIPFHVFNAVSIPFHSMYIMLSPFQSMYIMLSPFHSMYLMLSPFHAEDVDVNVTPDKRKVMLHQERVLLLLLRVRRYFLCADPLPTV